MNGGTRPRHLAAIYTRTTVVNPAALAAVAERPTTCEWSQHGQIDTPLDEYDESYLFEPESGCAAALTSDPYLFPRLTQNERERLTALHYYTRGIEHDRSFLAHMQSMVDLIAELIPLEHILLGLVDRDVYTEIAASSGPLSIFPRREIICAHTLNQPAGDVLQLTNMGADARFAGVPFVAERGLAQYAGTALRLPLAPGRDAALGTLCGISFAGGGARLNARQCRVLVRFADLIIRAIVARSQGVRCAEQCVMAARINHIASADGALAAARTTFPDADVAVQVCPDGTIVLRGGGAPVPVALFDAGGGIWEDAPALDADLRAANHAPWAVRPGRTLRALAARCPGAPGAFLVVERADATRVFDDADAAFVGACALAYGTLAQAAQLVRAAHPCTFEPALRGPIADVLSTCEVLVAHAQGAGAVAGADRAALLRHMLEASTALLGVAAELAGPPHTPPPTPPIEPTLG